MHNPKLTPLPNHTVTAPATVEIARKGIHLVSSKAVSSEPRPSEQPQPALASPERPEAIGSEEERALRAAEAFRLKLAACFGAAMCAPIVWCLHSMLLSIHVR